MPQALRILHELCLLELVCRWPPGCLDSRISTFSSTNCTPGAARAEDPTLQSPLDKPFCHITVAARCARAAWSTRTCALTPPSPLSPACCCSTASTPWWPKRQATALSQLHLGPFQHKTQAGGVQSIIDIHHRYRAEVGSVFRCKSLFRSTLESYLRPKRLSAAEPNSEFHETTIALSCIVRTA